MCACRLLFVKLKVMENMACTKIIKLSRMQLLFCLPRWKFSVLKPSFFLNSKKINHMKSVFLYYGIQHWHDVFYHFHLAIFAIESRSFRFVFKLNFASLQISITVDICQTKTFLNFLSLWVCPRFCVERRLTERKIFGQIFFSSDLLSSSFVRKSSTLFLASSQSSFDDLHWNFFTICWKKNVVLWNTKFIKIWNQIIVFCFFKEEHSWKTVLSFF